MSTEDVAAIPLSATDAAVHAAAPARPAATIAQSAGDQRRAALLTAPILPTLLKLAAPLEASGYGRYLKGLVAEGRR